MTHSLAIVGAGAAGCGVAYALRETSIDVTVFEKSRGVGGRAATRRRNGCYYDHGANYIKPTDDRTETLLESLGTDGLVDIAGPVWTHDAAGRINESDDQEAHKWSYATGITQFAKRVLAETDATVQKSTRITRLEWENDGDARGWQLVDEADAGVGRFDAVALTAPAPQTADIVRRTHWVDERRRALAATIDAVPYRTIRSVMLHYPFELDRPYYALVNPDRNHPIGWLSREECKTGHVPAGESLLVVQMSPEWSTEHYDHPEEQAGRVVANMVATLLDDDRLAEPDWVDTQGWRYALPDASVADGDDEGVVQQVADAGLYFAGDWVVGEGRVHVAFWNGVSVGQRIGESLE
ncbi:NAD(P)/FAD-dependent oxidoreductase [Haladaptatus sp. GCM10025707]|uniref:NAD(P)/FAD-dependent oxidoreductase n=1 Tax=unclassified Haladaptatus TaxID=2622732 RepID=UPI0023E7636D|nr:MULTISPECIES: FAD-dependent oxidoreductase [unclassified Haladaptatus]